MKYIIISLTLSMLFTIANGQVPLIAEEVLTETSDKDNSNVKITISHYHPYCGGAAPSQDILDNQSQLMANTTFNLINLATKKKTKVTTDAQGVLNLALSKGNYAIQELYKDCSFASFMKQVGKQDGMYYEDMGSACYKKWWKSHLGEFAVTSADNVQNLNMGTHDACFTGNNPCLRYNGPYPP